MDKPTLQKEIKELEKNKEKLLGELAEATLGRDSTIDAITKAEKKLDDVKKQVSEHNLDIQKKTENLVIDVQTAYNDIQNKKSEFDIFVNNKNIELEVKEADISDRTIKLDGSELGLKEYGDKLIQKEVALDSLSKRYEDIEDKIAHNELLIKQIKIEQKEVNDKESKLNAIQKSIDQKIAENEDLLQKIIKNKADVESRQDELEQTYELNKTVLVDISDAQDKMQGREQEVQQRELALLKDKKEFDSQKQILEEKEYNLTILDLNLKDKQKKIVQASKLYKLDK